MIPIWDEVNLLICEARAELAVYGYVNNPGSSKISDIVKDEERLIGARVFAIDDQNNYGYIDVFYPEDWEDRYAREKEARGVL